MYSTGIFQKITNKIYTSYIYLSEILIKYLKKFDSNFIQTNKRSFNIWIIFSFSENFLI